MVTNHFVRAYYKLIVQSRPTRQYSGTEQHGKYRQTFSSVKYKPNEPTYYIVITKNVYICVWNCEFFVLIAMCELVVTNDYPLACAAPRYSDYNYYYKILLLPTLL